MSVPVTLRLRADLATGVAGRTTGEQTKRSLRSVIPPMQGRGPDALTAFLHYFEHHANKRYGRGGRGQGGR